MKIQYIRKLTASYMVLAQCEELQEWEKKMIAHAPKGNIVFAECVQENGEKYLNTALKILEGLYENCDFSESEQSILQNGSVAYHCEQIHIPIIYGDYFLLEALIKLSENVPNFWCAGKNDKKE